MNVINMNKYRSLAEITIISYRFSGDTAIIDFYEMVEIIAGKSGCSTELLLTEEIITVNGKKYNFSDLYQRYISFNTSFYHLAKEIIFDSLLGSKGRKQDKIKSVSRLILLPGCDISGKISY